MKFATDGEPPLVSVCLLTYNHQRWIEEAIESVLKQETGFPCEFIIAEDCSNDQTREIVLRYAEKFPIRLILQEKNKGAMRNLKDLMDAPAGKYVAYIEGDDSWLDPLKLEKQAKLLEQNDDIALCYSNAKMFDTENPASVIFFQEGKKPPAIRDRYHAVVSCPAPSCTLFFRNLLKPYPEWAQAVKTGDHLIIALACKWGHAFYMDECLGLYNHDYTGLSRVIGQEHYLYDDFLPWFNLYEHYNRDPKIWEAIIQKGYCDIEKLFYRGWPPKARRLFWKWPLLRVMKIKRMRISLLKMAVKLHFPFFIPLRKLVKG